MKTATITKDATILRHLRGWLAESTPADIEAGRGWYRDAMDYARYLSNEFNVSRKVAAGVISALSPNNKWERNKIDAFTVLQAVRDGLGPEDVKVCTYDANKRKAFAIARGDESILRKSPKTYAFAMNVGENSSEHVTVDKWHMRACLTSSRKRTQVQESPTAMQYRRIEGLTARLAKRKGYKGYELQAIIWVTIKRHWEGA
tara:strand:+ start:719 stop:1324 length:606 start_codon:yes stop_codon:yes gene_type:complete